MKDVDWKQLKKMADELDVIFKDKGWKVSDFDPNFTLTCKMGSFELPYSIAERIIELSHEADWDDNPNDFRYDRNDNL